MKMKQEIYKVFVAFFLLTTVSISNAQDTANGFYVGVGVGHSDQKDACDDISGSCDDTDTGWKIFAGYEFNQYLSLEGGYADLGESDADTIVLGIPVSADAEITGFFLSGIASWPINDSFSVFGKLGAIYWDVETDADGGGISVSEDENGTDLMFGVGAQYDFTDNIGIRAEWERFNDVGDSDTGESDIDLISGSLVYRF